VSVSKDAVVFVVASDPIDSNNLSMLVVSYHCVDCSECLWESFDDESLVVDA
jgi:hypothetical protein